jgi:probable O-glycosylation ligase (exosortase A-associated)
MWIMPQAYDDRIASIKTAESDESFQGRVTAWHVAWDYARDHFPMGNGFSGSERPQVFNKYYPNAETHAAHSIFFQVLGDTGFGGLVLYLALPIGAFINCSRTKSLARGRREYEWAYDLADMMQLSLFAFCLGGSALSLAYYDVLFILVGLALALRIYVAKHVTENELETSNAAAGRAGSLTHAGARFARKRGSLATR